MEERTVSVLEYGAVGDGKTLNTEALQKAISELPRGGILSVPKGIFLTGALSLKSHMTLSLEEGAVLLGSPDPNDYPIIYSWWEGKMQNCRMSLVNVRSDHSDLHVYSSCDISILGKGMIHANGALLGPKELSDPFCARGRALYVEHTEGLRVEGVTIRESPSWCFHLFHCRNIQIRGISIYNKYKENGEIIGIANNDGIDPECCTDMEISDCFIESEDDNIAIKSGRNEAGRAYGEPSARIRVHNCRLSCGFGIACGSEMSGGIRDIQVSDCSFQNSFSIGSVKNQRGRGAAIENVTYQNCTLVNHDPDFKDCKWFRGAINIDQFYGLDIDEKDLTEVRPVTEETPAIRNISFQNIAIETVGGNAVYICGLPEMHVDHITLENVKARASGGFILRNADHVTLKNVQFDN